MNKPYSKYNTIINNCNLELQRERKSNRGKREKEKDKNKTTKILYIYIKSKSDNRVISNGKLQYIDIISKYAVFNVTALTHSIV